MDRIPDRDPCRRSSKRLRNGSSEGTGGDKFAKCLQKRFGVVLSEVMKNHHVSGSDLMFYAGMHKENVFAI